MTAGSSDEDKVKKYESKVFAPIAAIIQPGSGLFQAAVTRQSPPVSDDGEVIVDLDDENARDASVGFPIGPGLVTISGRHFYVHQWLGEERVDLTVRFESLILVKS
jgi:hypothetical protein